MSGSVFKEASALFKRKKYSRVISLLEPKVTLYRGSFRFFYLLGMSCLYLRDWGAAYSYLKTAHLINDSDLSIATAYGLILVRKGKRKEGLEVLLSVVERHELRGKSGYRKAARALEMVRRAGNEKDVVEILDRSRFSRYFPAPPLNYTPMLFIMVVCIAAGIAYPLSKTLVFEPRPESRSNLASVVIDAEENITDYSEGVYGRLLSEKEIRESFSRAKKYMEDFRDNLARREVNRLLTSNASIGVKQKAMTLGGLMRRPDLKSDFHSFSHEEVSGEPELYNRCYVKWKGRLSSLAVGQEEIRFDFLVGYHDRKVVEGIIPAVMQFEALLDESYAYELLAMVVVQDQSDKGSPHEVESGGLTNRFALKVISIRRIHP